jgi:ubiquinone/menaquinone biosynthesis C-methylase UbiE
MSSKLANPEYLRKQYQDSSNLQMRITLHDRFSVNKQGWLPWVFDQFDVPHGGRVLEVGCGPGTLWVENAPRIPHDWDITLTDFSHGMVREAACNCRPVSERFKYVAGDAQALPFDAGQLDVVIANHMLYHVPNIAKSLADIRRVLKSGGRLYASTVGRDHMRELHELGGRFDSTMWGEKFIPPFTLENGQEVLAPWFAEVVVHQYQDALVVTEAEPLIAYALSGVRSAAFTDEKRAAFTEFVNDELARHGAIYITKASGIFEARRA